MTNGDVRGACLALIKSRLGGPATGRWTQPAALGWKLENGSVSAAELAALCAAWIADNGAPGDRLAEPRRWAPSPALRAFFAEYRKVRGAGEKITSPERPPRGRRGSSRAAERSADWNS